MVTVDGEVGRGHIMNNCRDDYLSRPTETNECVLLKVFVITSNAFHQHTTRITISFQQPFFAVRRFSKRMLR